MNILQPVSKSSLLAVKILQRASPLPAKATKEARPVGFTTKETQKKLL